jgi:hypothetical protein
MNELESITKLATNCKSELLKISESFKGVASFVKSVDDVVRSIDTISGGKLPVCEIGDVVLPRADLTDESFILTLSKLFHKRSDEERLKILTETISKYVEAVRDYERKVVKLSSRISMQPESAERTIAIRQKQKINETIAMLRKRIDNLIDRFFKFRRAMLMRILGETEKLTNNFFDISSGYEAPYRERFKNKLKSELVIDQYKAFNSKFKA